MRTFSSILTALGFAVSLQSATQTIKVSPSALTGWTVTGVDQATLAAQSTLALPAGTQLSRPFRSSSLTVSVTSQVLIGPDSRDWPVIEIGSDALVFARAGTNGKLLLVAGDDAPVELPIAFALDKDGRSTEPLTVVFGGNSSALTIEASGKTLTFPVGTNRASSLELVLSAGSSEPWLFDDLAVTADSSEALTNANDRVRSGNAASEPAGSKKPMAGNAAVAIGLAPTDPLAAISPAANKAGKGGSRSTALEIFTPPAIRHGRVETVRAAAAQVAKK